MEAKKYPQNPNFRFLPISPISMLSSTTIINEIPMERPPSEVVKNPRPDPRALP